MTNNNLPEMASGAKQTAAIRTDGSIRLNGFVLPGTIRLSQFSHISTEQFEVIS